MLVHELQVYKDTYELVKMIFQIAGKLPKLYKFTIGENLCKDAIALFVPIQLANRAEKPGERAKYLERFFLTFESVKVYLRLLYDLRAISITQYSMLTEITVVIGKQINGWKNHTQTSPESSKPRQ